MKYLLILSLFIVNSALACNLAIPVSYVPTFLNPPVVGAYAKCDTAPEDQCICIDDISPYYSELVDEMGEGEIYTGRKIFQESSVKKAAYEASLLAASQLEAGLALVRKARACGSSVIDLMLLRNAQKSLSIEQKKIMANALSEIINLLNIGSLPAAKDEIQAAIVENITDADKAAALAKLDECD